MNTTGGVSGARIRRLRVSVPRTFQSVTLEAAPEGGQHDIHEMLDQHFPIEVFPREELMVTMVCITIGYTAGGKNRTLTFDLTSKGNTSLLSRSDSQQKLGEQLLRNWGIQDA